MAEFFCDRDFDLFKQTFSVPGVPRIMLLKSAFDYGASIPLTTEIDADLYHTMQDNITGGSSVIYHRNAEVDKTFVRGDKSQPCKLICGEDSNSLYPSVYLSISTNSQLKITSDIMPLISWFRAQRYAMNKCFIGWTFCCWNRGTTYKTNVTQV